MSQDALRSRLARVGQARQRARAAEAEATAALVPLLTEAREAQVSVGDLMHLTGLSRQGVYDLVARGGHRG